MQTAKEDPGRRLESNEHPYFIRAEAAGYVAVSYQLDHSSYYTVSAIQGQHLDFVDMDSRAASEDEPCNFEVRRRRE